MSEHQRETAFLRDIILHDDSDERRELEKRIAQAQRDERCVIRATALAALFTALTVAGFAYGAILLDNFPYIESQSVIKVLCNIGLASLICLVAFAGLFTHYRRKLNRLREECRQVVKKLLESHAGKSRLATSRGSQLEPDNRRVAQGAAEAGDSLGRVGTLRELAGG